MKFLFRTTLVLSAVALSACQTHPAPAAQESAPFPQAPVTSEETKKAHKDSLSRPADVGQSYYVNVRFKVDTEGRIKDVGVADTDAPKELQDMAVAAIKRCRFAPGPSGSATRVIRFHLNEPRKP